VTCVIVQILLVLNENLFLLRGCDVRVSSVESFVLSLSLFLRSGSCFEGVGSCDFWPPFHEYSTPSVRHGRVASV
jgi:hypothetical protein